MYLFRNIGSLMGKFLKLVDVLFIRKMDTMCFQDMEGKGSRTREGNGYKFCTTRNGVGVIMATRLKDNEVQVNLCSDMICR